MQLLLSIIGAIGVAAGLAGLAHGFFNPDSRLIDTLTICGVVALMSGFVLIGLGSVVSRLQRLAEMLELQQFARNVTMSADVRPQAEGVVVLGPLLEPRPNHAPEPAISVPTPPDVAPLAATRTPQGTPPPGGAPEVVLSPDERTSVPKEWEWNGPASEEKTSAPAGNSVATASEPVLAGRGDEGPAEPSIPVPPSAQPDAGEAARRVLKSGVIEGMAYTLYSDGSVDAELPEGVMHFDSISEWRAHLRVGA